MSTELELMSKHCLSTKKYLLVTKIIKMDVKYKKNNLEQTIPNIFIYVF